MQQTFSIQEVLRSGYQLTKTHFFSLAGIMIVLFVFQAIVTIAVDERPFLQLLAQVFIMPGFSLATLSVFFRVSDGQKPEFTHLSERFHHYLNFIVVNILYGFAVLLGLILLIVPGIYLSIRLLFAQTIVAEKNLDPIEALRLSGELTKGRIWKLLGLNLVVSLVNICGLLLLGVGLLFTVPMTGIAMLLVYKKLSLEHVTPVQTEENLAETIHHD
jgi:uncharacterized membrane protein